MSIKEIAKQANVSIATVSRVLNYPHLVKKKTRDKVIEISKNMKYKKYNTFSSLLNKQDEIAVIMPNVTNSFFAIIFEGIIKQANKYGFLVTICLTHEDRKEEIKIAKQLVNKNIKGVILIRAKQKAEESKQTIQEFIKHNIPFVLTDRDILSNNSSGVFLANTSAVYDAINLLIKNGYEKIAIIGGYKDNLNSDKRLDGYKKALLINNIKINKNLIYQGDFSMQSGLDIGKKILSKKNMPKAIFSCTNEISIGVLQAIKQKSLIVGKDIILFSFNKLDHAHINSFNISYIDHPTELMGQKSMTILQNKIIGTKEIIREIVGYKIYHYTS